jgi:glucosamine--fructose-6-phosphate aminotransferase (isomerizing)
MNGEIMAAEIREQPDVLERIVGEGWPAITRAAEAVRQSAPRFALFVARGTSDHAALYGKYLVETRLPLPAGLASPSTMTVYGARPEMRDVLVVAVSQSGVSPDIVEPVVQARAAGAITVAMTNSADSPLAGAAEFHLDVLAGPERAVAATKTYTAELLTLFLFFEALAGRDGAEAAALPARARAILAREEETARIAVRYRFAEQLVTTARGFNYPTAREAALKLMETSYLVAYAFAGADLLHGPVAMIDRGFPVIAIVPEGPGGAAMQPVLDGLRERGADTLIVGDPNAGPATRILPIPDAGPEHLTPILTILPIQQFVWHLARERGTDPDQPRGLSKVTATW